MIHDATLFAALADTNRLRALALLRHIELSVGELAQVLGLNTSAMSKHLKLLLDCGLITKRKEGNWSFLRLGDAALTKPVFELLDQWSKVHGTSKWVAADLARLEAVHAERAVEAQQYFAAHAPEWDRLRSLHSPTECVDHAVIDALGDHHPGTLVDIGTGTCSMLELFADRADHMIGIDRSPEMLRFGRSKLTEESIINFDLRQGDMHRLDLPSETADTVILHQVLHYSRHPATALNEAARILKPGGKMIIVDLAPHELEELRRDHAHVRLGFKDEEVVAYLHNIGISAQTSDHLEGGPLTITIWSGTRDHEKLRLVK